MALLACAHDAAPPVVVVPPPPPPAAPVIAAPPPAPLAPEPPRAFDFGRASSVSISAVPLKATAPLPIGEKPTKQLTLREMARIATKEPERRFTDDHAPYDPTRYNQMHRGIARVPSGAPAQIPLAYTPPGSQGKKPLHSIYASGGKLLIEYEPSFLAIVSPENIVETLVDMDPATLPLTEQDRAFADIDQAQYRDGILYVCRGYNASIRTRKGYVTALDAATGQLRWRSPAQTCGGTVAVFGDYLLTGYGEDIMPYQLKVLRRYDGALVQSIPNLGAAFDILVESDTKVVVETFRHRITYELR